jgi:hypothetical protein
LPGVLFLAEWSLIFYFVAQQTSGGSQVPGDKVRMAISGLSNMHGPSAGTIPPVALSNIKKEMREIQDLRDRLVSTCATMGGEVFTTNWKSL